MINKLTENLKLVIGVFLIIFLVYEAVGYVKDSEKGSFNTGQQSIANYILNEFKDCETKQMQILQATKSELVTACLTQEKGEDEEGIFYEMEVVINRKQYKDLK